MQMVLPMTLAKSFDLKANKRHEENIGENIIPFLLRDKIKMSCLVKMTHV